MTDSPASSSDPTPADDPCAARAGGESPPAFVVGIGASAGGLEALEALFRNMPTDTGMAFVVVQHLSPDFKSHMQDLLARETTLKICPVVEGMQVERDSIYLIPPRKEMVISEGRLRLLDRSHDRTLSHPIDRFFVSLAADVGARSVAVVLSGTGSDGSRGIRDVHEAGGLVIVQDERTAKFDGMPLNARATGVVDLELAPAEIPKVLVRYATEGVSAARLASDHAADEPASGVGRVFQLLKERFRINFRHYRTTTVSRRLERRMALLGIADLDQYVSRLDESPEELEALYRDLLIGVTRFFRDRDAFETLERRVIPRILEAVPEGKEVRVWVAGCATGEEAYSIAILLHEAMRRARRPVLAKVFATDVHRTSLEIAGAGVYSAEALEGVDEGRRERYFEALESGDWRIGAEIRQMLVFACHDVIADAPFTQLDLVSCRNLLIYFEPAAQKKVISLFHFALKTGGMMFLGHSETPGELSEEFESVDQRWRVFRKRRDVRLLTDLEPPHTGESRWLRETGRRPPGAIPNPGARKPDAARSLLPTYDRLLQLVMPPSFLVDRDFTLVHTFGGAEQLLKVPPGRSSSRLADLVGEGLRSTLIGAMQHALRTSTVVRYRGIVLPGQSDDEDEYRLVVQPIAEGAGEEPHLLVQLERLGPAAGDADGDRAGTADEATQEHIRSLEADLRFTSENLQATIEELQASNEELQATNEELVASNEELQSTNEELHSVNEELYTVNNEHQRKIAELTELTDDMNNLLASTQVGVIFLDRELRIRRFTPEIASQFRLVPADLGRSIETFSHGLDHPTLIEDLRRVLDEEKPIELATRDRAGAHLLLRMLPYRTDQSAVDGVVLTLVDISALRNAQDDLALFKFLSDNAQDAFLVAQADDGQILYANKVAQARFSTPGRKLVGADLYDLDAQYGHADYHRIVEQAREGDSPLFETELRTAGGSIPMEMSLSALEFQGRPYLFATARDITARREARKRLALEHAVIQAAAEETERERAARRFLDAFLKHLEFDVAELWSRTDENEIRLEEVLGAPTFGEEAFEEWQAEARAERFGPGVGLAGRVFAAKAAIWVRELQEQSDFSRREIAERSGLRTVVALPVMFDAECLGVVHLFSRADRIADPELLETLEVIGTEIGQYLRRIEKEDALRLRDRAIGSTTNGVIITGNAAQDFAIVYANAGFSRMTGYEVEEVLGRNCRFLQGDQTDSDAVSRIRAALADSRPCKVTVLNYRKDGTPFWNDLQITPVFDDQGEAAHFVGVQHDITRLKRIEGKLRTAQQAAQAANDAKSEFIANVSHELRTPMTAVLGFADVLLTRIEEPELADYAESIKRNGRYLLEIIDDILDLSKIEAGRLEVEIEAVDLEQLIGDIESLMQVRAREKGIPLRFEYATPVPREVQTDPIRVRQILVNLISNAIKFTEEGEVRVVVRVDREGSRQPRLEIRVEDTGIGMSEEEVKRLFEPFTQTKPELTRRVGGTGLGLTISRRLASRLDGAISIASQEGVGSTFALRLPIASLDDVEMISPEAQNRAAEQRTARWKPAVRLDARVLVVDDRRDVWRVARFFLEEAGAQVEIAEDGLEAVDMVKRAESSERPFRLVFMDMQMPRLDGYEATRALREWGYRGKIVALTAAAMTGERTRCLRVGCDQYLAKPVKGPTLVSIAAELLAEEDGLMAPRASSDGAGDRDWDEGRDGAAARHNGGPALRVLMVDDHPDAAEPLALLLRACGHQVRVAIDGAEALEVASEFCPDVVLTDLSMPNLDGFELVERLRRDCRESGTEPRVIVLTGTSSDDSRRRAQEAGIDHYLVKPVDLATLKSLLSEESRHLTSREPVTEERERL